ncbi:MAG: putative manganese transporter [Candidatus Thermoplasmatota archaeon]|nr:putative manganese transporter [Candidatus Thermoplasmatota archaeon]
MSPITSKKTVVDLDIDDAQNLFRERYHRILVAGLLFIAAIYPGKLGEITRFSVFDAYTQVSAFVAATLLFFFSLEHFFKIDVGKVMEKGGVWQVPTASCLGALPGCGGAVVVITAFSRGNITLGAMVAALIGTMGDAAFLLLAKEPTTYVKVMAISMIAAIICGWFVDRFHRGDLYSSEVKFLGHTVIGSLRNRDKTYILIAIPGLILGTMQLMQINLYELGPIVLAIGLGGAALSVGVWAISPVNAVTAHKDHPFTRTTEETSFVTVWVIAAYLAYEYAYAFLGLDLAGLAEVAWIFIPLLAILVGFIPGCGPQILVTTLYLTGIIPFAALIGNAISNDGDALFPAIALTPRMAIIATLYSAIPALIISYAFLFWG